MVASRRVASAFTSEQQRRSVTFFGEEEQDKRADVTRYHAGRSLVVFATTSGVRDRRRKEDCKTCVRRIYLAWIEIIVSVQFCSSILSLAVDRPNVIRPRFPPASEKLILLNCLAAAPAALLFLLKFLYGAGGNGSYIRGFLHFLRYGCQRVNDRCVCFFEILAYFLKCEVGNLF